MTTATVDLYLLQPDPEKPDRNFPDHRGSAVRTNATNAEDFLDSFAQVLEEALKIQPTINNHNGAFPIHDAYAALRSWLAQAFEIASKLKGYKAERVNEAKITWTGDFQPYHAWLVGSNHSITQNANESGYE